MCLQPAVLGTPPVGSGALWETGSPLNKGSPKFGGEFCHELLRPTSILGCPRAPHKHTQHRHCQFLIVSRVQQGSPYHPRPSAILQLLQKKAGERWPGQSGCTTWAGKRKAPQARSTLLSKPKPTCSGGLEDEPGAGASADICQEVTYPGQPTLRATVTLGPENDALLSFWAWSAQSKEVLFTTRVTVSYQCIPRNQDFLLLLILPCSKFLVSGKWERKPGWSSEGRDKGRK